MVLGGNLMKKRYAMIHAKCGQFVFYYSELPKRGEALKSKNVTLPDGTQPAYGSIPYCPTCMDRIGVEEITVHDDHRDEYEQANKGNP